MTEKQLSTQTSAEKRRDFLRKVGLIGGSVVIGTGMVSTSEAAVSKDGVTPPAWPWPYAELDPAHSADLAYAAFPEGKCCFASFAGIMRNLGEVVGAPYTTFPLDMMKYGEGGILGWGSVCGTLGGAASAVNLVCTFENASKVINELMAWYSVTDLPIYIPAGGDAFVTNASDSPLCHVSVSKWCDRSGFSATSDQRKARCRRLSADVAKKATELLNAIYAGTFVSQYTPATSVTECMTCHGPTVMNNTLGKMDCVSCHEPHTTFPLARDWWKSSGGCDLVPDGNVDEKDLVKFIELLKK